MGEKSDENYDFLIDDDDIKFEFDNDVMKVKENVMKNRAKRERLT